MISRLSRCSSVAVLILVAACGTTTAPTSVPSRSFPAASGAAGILPVPITGGFRVGDNRVVFTLTDATAQTQVAKPERSLSVGFHGPKGEAIAPAPYTFIWAVEGQNGVYVGRATFDAAGAWTAAFTTAAPGSPTQTTTFGFDVRDRLTVVSPGDAAPSVDTPT